MLQKNVYTNFDKCYKDIVNLLATQGEWIKENVRTKYVDGTPAYYKSYIGINFTLKTPALASLEPLDEKENANQFPAFLITTRKAAWKSSIRELFWIWFMRSNKVQDLRDLKCKYWDEFEMEDGTIGRAYAFQMAKPMCNYPSQTDYVIGELKNNPNSRRILTDLWNVEDTPYMSLTPCVFHTAWNVINGVLHLSVVQRSCDIALGLVANIFQYQILHRLIAKECNLKVGELNWTIHNAHIYDRHYDDLLKQVNEREIKKTPIIELPEFDSIYDIHPDDIKMITDYEVSGEQIKYEVAI